MEKNNIVIRNMTSKDLEYFEERLLLDFDDFWTYTVLEKEFYNSNTTYIVAEQNCEILGFAGILKIIDEANIMNIVTKKNKRKLGIGSLLLAELIKISRNSAMNSITLEVNENNIPAICLYKKYNFKEIGIRKKYYNNTDSAILMTLYL